MITFILTPVVFGIFFLSLAVGVIFSNKRLKGSCGGLSNMPGEDGKSMCELCSNHGTECDDQPKTDSTRTTSTRVS